MTGPSTPNRTLSPARKTLLQTLLEREKAKTHDTKLNPAGPKAMFRETALDTHQRAPIELRGPSDKVASQLRSKHLAVTSRAQAAQAARAQAAQAKPKFEAEQMSALFGSAAWGSSAAHQRHLAGLATAHRQLLETSEWALLDKLYTHMAGEEERMRAKLLQEDNARTRELLDGQLREHEQMRQAMQAQQAVEHQAMVARLKAEDEAIKAKEKAARAAAAQSRKEVTANVEATKQARGRLKKLRQLDEDRQLRDLQEELAQERAAAAAKVEEARGEMMATLADNAKLREEKKAAKAAQKARDAELTIQTLLAMEERDRKREREKRAFHDMIERRAAKASEHAVAEAKVKADRAEELLVLFEGRKKAEEEAAEAAKAARKAAFKAESRASQKAYLEEKAILAAERLAEQNRLRLELETKVELMERADAEKQAAARAKELETRRIIEGQILTQEHRKVADGTGMTEQERLLNAKLLEQAQRLVGLQV